MSCLAGSSHYSVALLEARLLVCIPGGLASFHPGSSPWPVTAAMQSRCLPRSEAARQQAGRFVFLRWARCFLKNNQTEIKEIKVSAGKSRLWQRRRIEPHALQWPRTNLV